MRTGPTCARIHRPNRVCRRGWLACDGPIDSTARSWQHGVLKQDLCHEVRTVADDGSDKTLIVVLGCVVVLSIIAYMAVFIQYFEWIWAFVTTFWFALVLCVMPGLLLLLVWNMPHSQGGLFYISVMVASLSVRSILLVASVQKHGLVIINQGFFLITRELNVFAGWSEKA